MRLVRVQVPEFRALKDVDISFEPEFTPQVFPLGSLNGGGKSTLLQLIFVLLHCSAHEERHQFIANMLERISIPKNDINKLLVKLELIDEDEEKIELEFTLCTDGYLRGLDIAPIYDKEKISFGVLLKEKELLSKRANYEMTLAERNSSNQTVKSLKSDEQYTLIQKEIMSTDNILNTIQPLISNISDNLTINNQHYITTYSCDGNMIGLLCHSPKTNKSIKDIKNILTLLSKHVFLSAPPTQVYLFLDASTKQSIFKKLDEKWDWNWCSYESELYNAKGKLPNFFTFDVFAVDILVSYIEKARNQDFKTLVRTGTNGTNYQKIIAELNLLTHNKKVLPQLDYDAEITGIMFETNERIEIYPEDLSHGELRRLSIYVWLKSLPSGENIVLMDEIENGFHPDWQYQIVRDLVEWGENNQYILATHSYELCNALTPAHVKELDPKLVNN